MSAKSKTKVFDFTIFEQRSSVCTDSDYTNCAAVNRLAVALKYYSSLDVHVKSNDDERSREIFRSFVQDVYREIIGDHNHLMLCHSHQFESICTLAFASKCNMETCQYTQRHFESDSVMNIVEDQRINFFVNLFDSLHFVIFHCFDAGFRVKAAEEKGQNEDKEKQSHELFDAEFSRLNDAIRARDHLTDAFERISTGNNTKFSIKAAESEEDTTWSDELFAHLLSECINAEIIQKLRALIERELFESDSIKIDVTECESEGNIAVSLDSKECFGAIGRFLKAVAGSLIFNFSSLLFLLCFQ